MREEQRPSSALTLLTQGDIELKGRMPWSSNATFLVTLCQEGSTSDAIYKPRRGERPLWDFPGGLYRREVAAFVLSEALGWGLVPETVLRHDAPFGEGSLQRFVDADFAEHYFTLVEVEEHVPQLHRMAVFDLLANNADRKSGHCLLTEDGRIWGIDHGLCFHEQPKLRTVIWEFAGHAISDLLRDDAGRLAADPPPFDGLLSRGEVDALLRRADVVSRLRRFPNPAGDRPYPWPLI